MGALDVLFLVRTQRRHPEHLEAHPRGREGRGEFVAHVPREGALALQGVVEPPEAPVHHRTQAAHLVPVRVVGAEPLVAVGLRAVFDHVRELSHGLQNDDREEAPRRGDGDEKGHRDGKEDVLQLALIVESRESDSGDDVFAAADASAIDVKIASVLVVREDGKALRHVRPSGRNRFEAGVGTHNFHG